MLNCGTTNEIKGTLFPNLAFNIETRLNHFRPINLTTLIKIYQKTRKGVEKVCSFSLSDNGLQTRSRDHFSSKKSLFEPNLASFNSFKCLNNRSFKPSNTTFRSYYVDYFKRNPLGHTNFKEISEIRARPHFNSRQHENEAAILKTREIFKNKHGFQNVTMRLGFARSVQIIVFPEVEIKKDIML